MAAFSSPLLEIERLVQNKAKTARSSQLDRQSIAELVDIEIANWNEDFRRGIRDLRLDHTDQLASRAIRNIVGYGPLEPLLDDDSVWEICINAPDQIFVKRHNQASGYHNEVFHDEDHVVRTLTRIMDNASANRRKFDPAEGIQDAQLESGARMHIVHADIGRGGHTIVNIRKFTGVAIRSLDELVSRNMLTASAAAFLRACVRARLSIIFAGVPGSGKTTLLSCCAAELDPSLRVVTAEEVFEADIPLPNVAALQTRAARSDRPEVDLRRLVAGFLRMAPDVAVVGEVRDREALPLLLTLSSGVTGYTTIHSGSARSALSRLRFIAQLSNTSSDLSLNALNSLVADSIDIVVHCERIGGQVRVSEIIAVEDQQTGRDATAFTTTPVFTHTDQAGLQWSTTVPQRPVAALGRVGYDMAQLQQGA